MHTGLKFLCACIRSIHVWSVFLQRLLSAKQDTVWSGNASNDSLKKVYPLSADHNGNRRHSILFY